MKPMNNNKNKLNGSKKISQVKKKKKATRKEMNLLTFCHPLNIYTAFLL